MVGCGPSLLEQRDLLSKLRQEFTFTCNGFYLWEDAPFTPSFYGINSNKRHHIEPATQRSGWHNVRKFLFKKAYPSYGLLPGWEWIPANFGLWMSEQGFKGLGDELPVLPLSRSSPLTFTQLAAWMGFIEFYFLGNDMTPSGHVYAPSGLWAERRTQGGLGRLLTSEEWEENIQVTLRDYEVAKVAIEKAGRKIYDCTPGGLLNKEGVLPFVPLAEVLA